MNISTKINIITNQKVGNFGLNCRGDGVQKVNRTVILNEMKNLNYSDLLSNRFFTPFRMTKTQIFWTPSTKATTIHQ